MNEDILHSLTGKNVNQGYQVSLIITDNANEPRKNKYLFFFTVLSWLMFDEEQLRNVDCNTVTLD